MPRAKRPLTRDEDQLPGEPQRAPAQLDEEIDAWQLWNVRSAIQAIVDAEALLEDGGFDLAATRAMLARVVKQFSVLGLKYAAIHRLALAMRNHLLAAGSAGHERMRVALIFDSNWLEPKGPETQAETTEELCSTSKASSPTG